MQNIRHRSVSVAAIVMGFFVVSGPVAHAEPTLDTSSFENFESSIISLNESLESNADLSITERGQVAMRVQFIISQIASSVAENPNKTPRELQADALRRFGHLNGLTAEQLLTASMEAPTDPEVADQASETIRRWAKGEATDLGIGSWTLVHEFGEGDYADRVMVYAKDTESGARLHLMTGILKSDLSGYSFYLGGKDSFAGVAAEVDENYKIDSLEIITEPINTAKTWFGKIMTATNKPSFMVREIPITSKARITKANSSPLIWAVLPNAGVYIYYKKTIGRQSVMPPGSDDRAREIVAANAEILSAEILAPEKMEQLESLYVAANIKFTNWLALKLTSDLPVVFEAALNDARGQRQQATEADIQRKNIVAANEDALEEILGPTTTVKPRQPASMSQSSGAAGSSVTYRARIGSRDLRNSKGDFLPDIPSIQARDILLQDRFNYHQEGIRDPEDTDEGLYEEGKETMRKFFEGKVARLADGGDPMPLLSSGPVVDVTLTENEIIVKPAE